MAVGFAGEEGVAVDLEGAGVGLASSAAEGVDAFTDQLERRLMNVNDLEPVARRVVEMMALALQASLLVRYSAPAVADAFCATRLDGDWGRAFGTLPYGLDTQSVVDRARIKTGAS